MGHVIDHYSAAYAATRRECELWTPDRLKLGIRTYLRNRTNASKVVAAQAFGALDAFADIMIERGDCPAPWARSERA